MNRFRIFLFIFCLGLSIPLAYFVFHSYRSLEQEELTELRYFANSLFDRMEEELAGLIQREESRQIDDYTFSKQQASKNDTTSQDLSQYPFVIGYIQNNPDGSFQSPLIQDPKHIPSQLADVYTQLQQINQIFNHKRTMVTENKVFRPPQMKSSISQEVSANLESKYFDSNRSPKKGYLGKQKKRVEKVSIRQALNIAQSDQKQRMLEAKKEELTEKEADKVAGEAGGSWNSFHSDVSARDEDVYPFENAPSAAPAPQAVKRGRILKKSTTFQAEIDPMQSVFIDKNRIFIFRRILIDNQIYRQGFVLAVKPFMQHLIDTYFTGQPLARFTRLQLLLFDERQTQEVVSAGPRVSQADFSLERTFPRPFSFVHGILSCNQIPRSEGRQTLNIMMVFIGIVLIVGMFAIYRSARAIVELSERRGLFVSSVTHELKTPLTNIRMYIEMLEQGIAVTPEREQDYFRILGSESARLSRLINNVLEFSKLEKKQRLINLETGNLREVISEVEDVMHQKIKQEGFELSVSTQKDLTFNYDREIMIQVLINLIENSIKFGKNSAQRKIEIKVNQKGHEISIQVSDHGPGIPKKALKKIFDDFYRVDDESVKTTRGTGIGLALVKKLIHAMNGRVFAVNNDGPGCTITIMLPQ